MAEEGGRVQPLSWGEVSNWGYMLHQGFFMCFVLLFFFLSLCSLSFSLSPTPPSLRARDVDLLPGESLRTSVSPLFPWPSQMG